MNPLNTVAGTITAGIVLAIVIAAATVGIAFNAVSFIVWIHVLAGITWIGLLYYFNFVQVPALADAVADEGGPGGAGITKYVAPRALWWFRWGALLTWLSGAAALGHYRIFADAFTLGLMGDSLNIQAMVIGVGAWLGTIMLFNVWVLIWPNQKKVLGLVEASADEVAKAKRPALLATRTKPHPPYPTLTRMAPHAHRGFFL